VTQGAAAKQPGAFAKIGYGILLPIAVFLAFQFALIESTRGDGTFTGMLLFFGLAWILPAMVVMNCWVIPLRWRRKRSVFLAGLLLPCVIGAVEALFAHPPSMMKKINGELYLGSPFQVKLYICLLFVQLAVSIVYALRRRGKNR
jgi:hypothetical protein